MESIQHSSEASLGSGLVLLGGLAVIRSQNLLHWRRVHSKH